MITRGIKTLCNEAEEVIDTLSVAEARTLIDRDDILFVDIRDVRELWRDGTIPGSYHAPRGMLEFWVDPESPYAKPVFQERRKFVFFCAGGLRSALATKAVQEMGLTPVAHVEGGFSAWAKAGGPIERRDPSLRGE